MDNATKQLQAKVEDYSRFVITLLIVSFYFYMGTLITTYLRPSQEGSILMILTSVSIITSFYFLLKWKKCKQTMAENEQ